MRVLFFLGNLEYPFITISTNVSDIEIVGINKKKIKKKIVQNKFPKYSSYQKYLTGKEIHEYLKDRLTDKKKEICSYFNLHHYYWKAVSAPSKFPRTNISYWKTHRYITSDLKLTTHRKWL